MHHTAFVLCLHVALMSFRFLIPNLHHTALHHLRADDELVARRRSFFVALRLTFSDPVGVVHATKRVLEYLAAQFTALLVNVSRMLASSAAARCSSGWADAADPVIQQLWPQLCTVHGAEKRSASNSVFSGSYL